MKVAEGLLRSDSNTGIFLCIFCNFNETHFVEHLRTAAASERVVS